MRKIKIKKKPKFRLLLDAAFARPSVFSQLQKKANVSHVVYGYSLSRQAEDEEIYKLAVKENRFVVTVNYKDFRKFVRKGKPGVIAIPANLTNKQIDLMLTDFVSKNNSDEYLGKAIKLTEENLKIKGNY